MAKSKPTSKMNSKKPTAKKAVSKPSKAKMTAKPKAKVTPKKATVKKAAPKKVATKKIAKPVAKAKPAAKVIVKKDDKNKKGLANKLISKAGKLVDKIVGKPVVKMSKAEEKKILKAKKDEEKKLAKLKDQQEKEMLKNKKKGKHSESEDEEGESKAKSSADDEDDEADFKRIAKSGKSKKFEDVEVEDFTPKSKKLTNKEMAELESKIADEIAELREHFNWKDITDAIATLDFFINPKTDECIERGCDNLRTTQNYCRLHYLKNWKTLQHKKEILKEGKLQEYIEELISKYPPKFMEAIMNDLSDDKEFYKVLHELNITSEYDFEEEDLVAADDDDDGDEIGIEATFTGSMRYEEDT